MPRNLTPKQEAWFAAVKASLEKETGRSLEDWAQIVRRDCPETKPRARAAWLKTHYGLGSNRAAQIIDAAYPPAEGTGTPEAERAALWTSPQAIAILAAVEAAVADFPDLVPTQRKAFTAWSRNYQFAALKPLKNDTALIGFAVAPDSDPRLSPAKKESWSERLKSTLILTTPADIAGISHLLKAAWQDA